MYFWACSSLNTCHTGLSGELERKNPSKSVLYCDAGTCELGHWIILAVLKAAYRHKAGAPNVGVGDAYLTFFYFLNTVPKSLTFYSNPLEMCAILLLDFGD